MKNKILLLVIFVFTSIFGISQTAIRTDSLTKARIAELEKIKPLFKAQKGTWYGDSIFASVYSDKYSAISVAKRENAGSFSPQLNIYTKSTYPGNAEADFVNANQGDIIGPFVSGNTAAIYKIGWKGISPDSAMVRHILIAHKSADAAGPEVRRPRWAAKLLADSLLNVIKSGKTKMVDLVMAFTDDPGSKNGNLGNYGWFPKGGQFVGEFVDASFNNPVGTVVVFETGFGFHVLEVLGHAEGKYCVVALPVERLIDYEKDYLERSVAGVTPPAFPGGMEQFKKYLSDSLKYPANSAAKHKEGKVEINFTVTKDGMISDVSHTKVLYENPEFVAEAKRLISAMPAWKPAIYKEQPINWMLKVTVPFRLQ
jgi:TonB family protein